ncbi:MAG: DUF192 domain-containing protein [Solirubrobacterales bacterium]|nr:DUF192 domain-containing protein [Solirubrobacterales bacterium]
MDQTPARLRVLRCLPEAFVGIDVFLAGSFRARLLGLAGLATMPVSAGLLIPNTRSIHTVGMRFSLDLIWLDGDGGVVGIDVCVAPLRLASCRRARSVVELISLNSRSPLPLCGDHLIDRRRMTPF